MKHDRPQRARDARKGDRHSSSSVRIVIRCDQKDKERWEQFVGDRTGLEALSDLLDGAGVTPKA